MNVKKNQAFCECPDGIPKLVAFLTKFVIVGISEQFCAPIGLIPRPKNGRSIAPSLMYNVLNIILSIQFNTPLMTASIENNIK